jgi:two-component sensor histidine kinase
MALSADPGPSSRRVVASGSTQPRIDDQSRDLAWSVTRTQQGLTLVLDWKESRGPTPKRSRRSGFGSRLINMVIERQLNGQVQQTFGPDGLEAKLTVPLTHERWPGGARAPAQIDLP